MKLDIEPVTVSKVSLRRFANPSNGLGRESSSYLLGKQSEQRAKKKKKKTGKKEATYE